METKQRVSTSTLKRILGFIKGTKEPRLYTLDVIAQYLGHENWDIYIDKFSKIENSEFVNLEQLDITSLCKNDKIEFAYEPNRKVTILYKGDFNFEVTESLNSKLQKVDKLKNLYIVKHYPLIINSVIRKGLNMGQFKAGKISGITNINVIKNK
ncbi:MAG: hypothetical protein HY958_08850 [Bacteroidia bacterium]|nr:hypothetical protein [Bacteroidia bacterium]